MCTLNSAAARREMGYTMNPQYASTITDDDLLTLLYNYGPVSVAFYADSRIMAYSSGVFTTPCNGETPNHAVTLGEKNPFEVIAILKI